MWFSSKHVVCVCVLCVKLTIDVCTRCVIVSYSRTECKQNDEPGKRSWKLLAFSDSFPTVSPSEVVRSEMALTVPALNFSLFSPFSVLYLHSAYCTTVCFILGRKFNFYILMTKPLHRHSWDHWYRMWTSPRRFKISFSGWVKGKAQKQSKSFLNLCAAPKPRWNSSSFCRFCQRFQKKLKGSICDSDTVTSPGSPTAAAFRLPLVFPLHKQWHLPGETDGEQKRSLSQSLCGQRPRP